MRTITTNIYQFDELSEQAQKNAIENYKNQHLEFFWSEDYLETIRKGLELFGAELQYYSIDWGNASPSYAHFSIDESVKYLKGEELIQYLKDCKGNYCAGSYDLTGFCADSDFLNVIEVYIDRKTMNTSLYDILSDCVNAVILSGCDDYEGTQEDESVQENLIANGYEFTENGDII